MKSAKHEDAPADRDYQAEYYRKNKKKRTAALRARWRSDPTYRAQEQDRNKRRRGELRAENGLERFKAMVAAKQVKMAPTRPPRFILIDGKTVQVWTSGSLGREVGRSPRAVSGWLREGVLPGASAFIGGAAFFTRDYCAAVWHACKRLFLLDGRGDRQVLKRLVREELAKGGVSYVPNGGDNERDRVLAESAVSA